MTQRQTLFLADDGVHGRELWSTDGTSAGTFLFRDLIPAPTGGPYGLVALTDGLAVATLPGNTTHIGPVYTNRVDYYGTDALFGGYSGTLTVTSGLGPGGWVGSAPLNNGLALVELFLPNGDGRAVVYSTNGNASTELVSATFGLSLQNIAPGTAYLYDAHLHLGYLTDGTPGGTHALAQSAPSAPAALGGGRFIYSADDAPLSGQPGLWVGDGVTATLLLPAFTAAEFTAFGPGRVLFAGNDPAHGTELWITDGTAAGTGLLAELFTFPAFIGSNPHDITDLGNGRAILLASTGGLEQMSMVVTDGTAAGTQIFYSIHFVGPDGFTALGNGLAVFSGQPGFFDDELWVTDGTTVGTHLLRDILPASDSSAPHDFHATGDGRAIFLADDGIHGVEPWITDGTAAGTFLLADIMPGHGNSLAGDFVTLSIGTTQTSGGWGQPLTGGPGPDTLTSPYGGATIDGGAGADTILAGGWGNTILGGPGNDTIEGGQGGAHIDAGSGDNTVHVTGWGDVITGGDGHNTVTGPQGGAVVTLGDGGNSVILAGWGNVVTTGAGADFIQSGDGGAVIDAGGGDNTIQSWGWGNHITVGNGNNSIEDFDGGAVVTAGGGNNSIGLHGWGNTVSVGNGHNHIVVGFGGGTSITAGDGGAIIELSGWNNQVTTGAGDDQVSAGMGLSNIHTNGGNDQIWLGASGGSLADAGDGNDTIITGGAWGDTLIGGAGDDAYVVTNASALVVELPGGGIDTVWVGADGFVMPANVELVRLFGAAASFSGGVGDDVIVGNQAGGSSLAGGAGADTLWGSAFADVFDGGTGNDVFYGGGGADRYVFAPGWGADAIGAWAPGSLLDFRGSGLAFTDLAIAAGGGFTLVTHGADSIQVYGAAGLTAADFLFG